MCDDLTSYNASLVTFPWAWVDDHRNDLTMGAELTDINTVAKGMIGIIQEFTFWALPMGLFQVNDQGTCNILTHLPLS
jgi:hypothetical protein